MRGIPRYLRLFMSDWLALMCGSASVPATIIAVFGQRAVVQISFGSFAVICWFLCGYRVWLKSQPNFTRERHLAARAEFSQLDAMAKAALRYILVRGEVNEEQITPTASFLDDLGADSLDTVELIMAFEEEFKDEIKGEIPESDAEKLQTVGQVIDYNKGKAGAS